MPKATVTIVLFDRTKHTANALYYPDIENAYGAAIFAVNSLSIEHSKVKLIQYEVDGVFKFAFTQGGGGSTNNGWLWHTAPTKVKVKLTGIDWDTSDDDEDDPDGDDIELPTELTVEIDRSTTDTDQEVFDAAVDKASDEKGWCINSVASSEFVIE